MPDPHMTDAMNKQAAAERGETIPPYYTIETFLLLSLTQEDYMKILNWQPYFLNW